MPQLFPDCKMMPESAGVIRERYNHHSCGSLWEESTINGSKKSQAASCPQLTKFTPSPWALQGEQSFG